MATAKWRQKLKCCREIVDQKKWLALVANYVNHKCNDVQISSKQTHHNIEHNSTRAQFKFCNGTMNSPDFHNCYVQPFFLHYNLQAIWINLSPFHSVWNHRAWNFLMHLRVQCNTAFRIFYSFYLFCWSFSSLDKNIDVQVILSTNESVVQKSGPWWYSETDIFPQNKDRVFAVVFSHFSDWLLRLLLLLSQKCCGCLHLWS